MKNNMKESHINRNWLLYPYALILFMMNFIRVFDNSFWGDEGFTIRLAKVTFAEMIVYTAADVHPPLYYMLAQLLYRVLGNNGIAYHLSGLLPYAVIMILGCTIVKKYFGTIPAFIMVTMASLMRNAVIYNVEARMYALASMLILISYIAFYKIIELNHPGSWVIFSLSSLGAAYTHYYALITVAFLYVMLLPLAIKKKEHRKGLLISYIAAILGYLPWLMILVKSFGRTASGWWLNEIPSLYECVIFFLDSKWMIPIFSGFFILYVAYRINALNLDISKEGKLKYSIMKPKSIEFDGELYWIISGIISAAGTAVVGLTLSHLIRPLFITRYLFPASSMVYLMLGVVVSRMKLCKIWTVAVIIAILFVTVPDYIQIVKDDYNLNRSTIEFLNVVRLSGDAEIVTNSVMLEWTLLEYYYPDNMGKYAEDTLDTIDKEYNDIWLFWERELNDTEKSIINEAQYTYNKFHEGLFADGTYFHVYRLERA